MKLNFLGFILFSILGFFVGHTSAFTEIQQYENYLNEVKTLSGNFTQINSKGQTVTGTIQISRPGKMRLTYNPPSSLVIVADGKWLITKDREADQVDYISLDKTPAAFILKSHIKFSGDVEVTNVVPKENATEVSLIRKEDPEAGSINLVFQESPVALKEWSVVDAQGIETRVILSNIKSNVQLSPTLFAIESPSIIQQIF